MKKMTRKLALLLVMALLISTCLFTLSACDDDDDDDGDEIEIVDTLNGKTPLEIYREAETKLESASNAEMSGVADISVKISGDGISVNQSMDMTMLSQINGETMYTKITQESSGVAGSNMIQESWLVGGMFYERIEDEEENYKVKTPMTYDEYIEADGDDSEYFIDITSGLLDNAKFKKDGNNYYLDLKLTGEQIQQYAGDLVSSFGNGMAFDTLNYRMCFDQNGDLKGFNISFGGSATEEGMTMEMEMTMRVDVKYGTVGTITAPADAGSYELETY